jgi:hypothetical protein
MSDVKFPASPNMNIDEINAYLKTTWPAWSKEQWLVICSIMRILGRVKQSHQWIDSIADEQEQVSNDEQDS